MYSGGEPVLFEDNVFKVEIPLSNIINTADNPPINYQQSLMPDYINKNGSISNAEAYNILDLKPTRVKEILREMVESQIISSVGEKKGRRYCLIDVDKFGINTKS